MWPVIEELADAGWAVTIALPPARRGRFSLPLDSDWTDRLSDLGVDVHYGSVRGLLAESGADFEAVADLAATAAGAAAAAGPSAAAGAAAGVVSVAGLDFDAFWTPPWPLHAPRPLTVEVVPSLQVFADPEDIAGAAGDAAGSGAAASAFLALLAFCTPP